MQSENKCQDCYREFDTRQALLGHLKTHRKDAGVIERPHGSGRWWVRILINGRERRYRCDSKSQAKALYSRLKADAREGRYFPEKYDQKKDITFRSWVQNYTDSIEHVKSYRTQKHYGRWWRLVLGKRLLSEVTTQEIQHIQGRIIKKEIRAPQTMNRYLAFLRHVLNLAIKDGHITRNPVSGVKFSPEPQGRLRFLSDKEIMALKEAMTPEDWKVVAFALETGMRQENQFKAKWEWVDQDRGIMTIPRTKAQKTQHIPLSDGALEILKSLRSWIDSPYIFPSPRIAGQPMQGRNFMVKAYSPALEKAKILDANWHTLRHTFASRLVMAGVDLRTVQELMGHSTITMTMRYAHLSPGHLREAINRVTLGKIEIGNGTRNGTKEKEVRREVSQPVERIGGGDRIRTDASQFCRLLP